MSIIKQISAADTWDLRHRVMWPEQPFEYVQLAEDEAGIHFGLFENKQIVLSKSDAIDFTMNLCHWLFEQTFTVSRISMIKTA